MTAAQLRHESPELGDAIVRMMRALVTRAEQGDTEAIEQLARLESMAPVATTLAAKLAHESMSYSYTELAGLLGTSRQAARQRVERMAWVEAGLSWVHVLTPGHTKRGCEVCK